MSPLTHARALAVAASVVLSISFIPPSASAQTFSEAPAAVVTETAPSAPTVFGYYSLPWTSTVYESWTDGKVTAISAAAWKSLGVTKDPAPIRYVKASWSSSKYALVTFPRRTGDVSIDRVVALTADRYRAAGTPPVSTVADVPTSIYYRFASSSGDHYVRTPDARRHKLTAQEYRSAGSPSLKVVYGGYYRTKWSTTVSFVSSGGQRRTLTSAQYAAAGRPKAAMAPTTFVKTAWSGPYALVTWPHTKNDTSVDQVVALTSAQYEASGKPRLGLRPRIPGDSFVRLDVGTTIYHRLADMLIPVSSAQWQAAGSPKVTTVAPKRPTYIRGVLIVNKSLPLPASYGNGLRPELRSAFAKMRAAAQSDGVSLRIISGFRSYASQKSVYAAKIRQYGYATAQLRSARPGHSEHQTGLAIDVNSISQAWGDTKAGRWVAKNAHRFGFIVRYPKGKTPVTGYAYEPWHLRHVGVEVATRLVRQHLTLDEYLGVPSKY